MPDPPEGQDAQGRKGAAGIATEGPTIVKNGGGILQTACLDEMTGLYTRPRRGLTIPSRRSIQTITGVVRCSVKNFHGRRFQREGRAHSKKNTPPVSSIPPATLDGSLPSGNALGRL